MMNPKHSIAFQHMVARADNSPVQGDAGTRVKGLPGRDRAAKEAAMSDLLRAIQQGTVRA
jgi:hypothetical protein